MDSVLRSVGGDAIAVRDIMQTQVVTVTAEMTVRELVRTLGDRGISGAPVVDSAGRLVGVVSATDVVRFEAHHAEIPSGQVSWEPGALPEEATTEGEDPAAYYLTPESSVRFTAVDPAFGGATEDYTVGDIMTPVAFTVRPSDSLPELVRFFVRGRIHRAPVVEEGTLRGIVTPFDVLRALLDEEPR